MRSSLPGYYRPTEKEFAELWERCTLVFDANMLLNLYCYSQATREEVLGICRAIPDRLWLPHQAALEYHRNRPQVIHQQKAAYDAIQELLQKARADFEGNFRSRLRQGRHPFIEADRMIQEVDGAFAKIDAELSDLKENHPDLSDGDPIRDAITELFQGKVGPAYSSERLQEIYAEGEMRYNHKPPIPPGYEDAREDGDTRQYGDLIMWFQLIDYAKKTKKPLILITDDRKEDWWWKIKGKVLGPRPELVDEIASVAGVGFYMYPADPFMEHAGEYLKLSIKQEAIDEVRDVRIQAEESLPPGDVAGIFSQPWLSSLAEAVSTTWDFLQAADRVSALEQLGGGRPIPMETIAGAYDRQHPEVLRLAEGYEQRRRDILLRLAEDYEHQRRLNILRLAEDYEHQRRLITSRMPGYAPRYRDSLKRVTGATGDEAPDTNAISGDVIDDGDTDT